MASKITKLNSDFQEKMIKKNQEPFILTDKKQKISYSFNEILNKVIFGDYLKIMKKLSAEFVDCVFVDSPYFLQLPPKKLLRWIGSVVNGVNDQWDVFKDLKNMTILQKII